MQFQIGKILATVIVFSSVMACKSTVANPPKVASFNDTGLINAANAGCTKVGESDAAKKRQSYAGMIKIMNGNIAEGMHCLQQLYEIGFPQSAVHLSMAHYKYKNQQPQASLYDPIKAEYYAREALSMNAKDAVSVLLNVLEHRSQTDTEEFKHLELYLYESPLDKLFPLREINTNDLISDKACQVKSDKNTILAKYWLTQEKRTINAMNAFADLRPVKRPHSSSQSPGNKRDDNLFINDELRTLDSGYYQAVYLGERSPRVYLTKEKGKFKISFVGGNTKSLPSFANFSDMLTELECNSLSHSFGDKLLASKDVVRFFQNHQDAALRCFIQGAPNHIYRSLYSIEFKSSYDVDETRKNLKDIFRAFYNITTDINVEKSSFAQVCNQ